MPHRNKSNNADASILLSDFGLTNDRIEGARRVDTSDDDDYMGFVFGYQNATHYYLFDWKQSDQGDSCGSAERGMHVKVISANSTLTCQDFWPTAGNGTRVRTLFHNTTPWQDFTEYKFTLDFSPGRFTITVKQGDTTLETINIQDNTYQAGKFGFYNYSQGQVIYSGFRRTILTLPDLTASLIRKNDTAFPTSIELTARIGNGGGEAVPPNAKVSFYLGDPASGGKLIGMTQTSKSLSPGEYEDVKVTWSNPPTGLHPITVVADDNGSGQGTVTESNEANNKAMANIALGIGPFILVDDLVARFKDGIVDLKWSSIPDAVSYNIYRRSGDQSSLLIKQGQVRPNYSDSALTNGTTYYYTVRWVNAGGVESGNGTEMSATPTSQGSRDNVPPTILSPPDTLTRAKEDYSYDARALDPNRADTLSYSLPAPLPEDLRGMTINPATGLIGWKPTLSQVGYHDIPVRVEDSRGRFAAQTYRLFVEIQNSPPIVNAGPDQILQLAAQLNPATTPTPTPTPNPDGTITLTPISTGFNSPIGIDYHPTSNKIVMSVNYSSGGQPYNLELVAADGGRTRFSNTAGLTDELKIATVRTTANGFTRGELFTGSGASGVIVRISPDGSVVQNPWVTLPGEGGLMRGSLHIDRTGVFGGDLIVVTTAGGVWRVNSTGQATRLASLGTHLEGLSTIPDDPARYGPWAGKILIGAEGQGRLYTVDVTGSTSFFEIGISPEDIDIVPPNENFFGVDFGAGRLMGAAASQFAGMIGDLLISQEGGGPLYRVHWNGTAFEKTLLATVARAIAL